MYDKESQISFTLEQLVTILRCPFSIFTEDRELEQKWGGTTGGYEILQKNPEIVEELFRKTVSEYPYVRSDKGLVLFVSMWMNEKSLLVAGPVCTFVPDFNGKSMISRKYGIGFRDAGEMGVCSADVFFSGMAMLFSLITKKQVTLGKILEHNFASPYLEMENKKKRSGLMFEWQEEGWVHNPYVQEVREQEAIKNGDTDELTRTLDERFEGKYGRVAKDELRQQKNLAIGVITMASRSAIRGGLHPEASFFMADTMIQKIEEQTDPHQVIALKRQAEFDYANEVKKIRKPEEKNSLVEAVKQYITVHIQERIRVTDIAKSLGFHPDYLSSVFAKSEKKTISAYIQSEKIRRAKELLTYSDLSIKEISASLSFCSQSHFGEVFMKEENEPPAQYRKKNKSSMT